MTVFPSQLHTHLSGWRLDLLWLLPAVLSHALGLALYVNWADAIDNPPIHYTDYATHYAAVDAVSHFLSQARLWGYSPFFLAGFAEGTLVDIDNKGVELASYWLSRVGLSLPHAYNVVMLSLMAGAPFAVFATARQLNLSAATAGVAQLMMLTAWYGDGALRWMWQGSILAFAAAALGSLLVAAAFWRWASAAPSGNWFSLVLWFGLGPLLFWLHAEAFVLLALALGCGTLFFGRRWPRRAGFVLLAWAAFVILCNWPWLGADLRFLSDLAPTGDLQGGLSQLRYDLTAPHALLRLAIFGSALAGLWAWRRAGLQWWVTVAACTVLWLGLAYAAGYLGLGALEPYRLVLPALALATLPAADWLVTAWPNEPRRTSLVFLALACAAALALYVARPQHLRQPDGTPSDYLSGPQPAEQAVCRTLSQLDLGRGRVLINDWRLGAWLPTCSGAQVIGGPTYLVWTKFNHANADWEQVFGQPVSEIGPVELSAVLSQYNVHWIVVNTDFRNWENLVDWDLQHPGLMQPVVSQGPFEIMAVAHPATWLFQGDGVVRAGYNRITVRGATDGGLVLKYHWLASLRTMPALPIRPVYIGGDPVPFIAVDNGKQADFDIIQNYD